MRIRTIKPEFFKHDGVAALPALTRILLIGLWSMADGWGRLQDRPTRIKVEVLPYDDIDVDDELSRLHEAGFIVRYSVGDERLIEIPKFRQHQNISGKEFIVPSKFPSINEGSVGEVMVKESGRKSETQERKGKEGNKGKEQGKGKESEERAASSLPTDASGSVEPSATLSPIVLTFPTSGKVSEWHLREDMLAELVKLYPEIDPKAECEKALSKIKARAVTMKTANGMHRFLFSWMDRATNSNRSSYQAPDRNKAGWL